MLEVIANNIPAVLGGVSLILEGILRLKPSNRNWSLIDNALRVVNTFIPNKKKDGDKFRIK